LSALFGGSGKMNIKEYILNDEHNYDYSVFEMKEGWIFLWESKALNVEVWM